MLKAFYDESLGYQDRRKPQEPYIVSFEILLKIYGRCDADFPTEATERFTLVLEDLLRLGLIRIDINAMIPSAELTWSYTPMRASIHNGYYLTSLAIKFMAACQPGAWAK